MSSVKMPRRRRHHCWIPWPVHTLTVQYVGGRIESSAGSYGDDPGAATRHSEFGAGGPLSRCEGGTQPFADPVLFAFLNAAEDDEETMAEDLQASRQARRNLADLTAADRAAVEAAIRRLAEDSSQGDYRKLRADRAGGFT
jgi:hypothetical protein